MCYLGQAISRHIFHFSQILFTDECRAKLDGPDGCACGWLQNGQQKPVRFRHQQWGGEVIFWAGIINDCLLGSFRVDDNGVKINSENYMKLLSKNLILWYKTKSAYFKRNFIFMQDNAPKHAAKSTREFLSSQ